MNGRTEQPGLFTEAPAPLPATASGVRRASTDPAANDAALTGDGYQWLRELVTPPPAPTCERCGRVMVLPASAPVVWACPTCNPEEPA